MDSAIDIEMLTFITKKKKKCIMYKSRKKQNNLRITK